MYGFCILILYKQKNTRHISRLAQSVEHQTLNLRVVGSSPTLGDMFYCWEVQQKSTGDIMNFSSILLSFSFSYSTNVYPRTQVTFLWIQKCKPDKGLEPLTLRLKVWCSTDWASRASESRVQRTDPNKQVNKAIVLKGGVSFHWYTCFVFKFLFRYDNHDCVFERKHKKRKCLLKSPWPVLIETKYVLLLVLSGFIFGKFIYKVNLFCYYPKTWFWN